MCGNVDRRAQCVKIYIICGALLGDGDGSCINQFAMRRSHVNILAFIFLNFISIMSWCWILFAQFFPVSVNHFCVSPNNSAHKYKKGVHIFNQYICAGL